MKRLLAQAIILLLSVSSTLANEETHCLAKTKEINLPVKLPNIGGIKQPKEGSKESNERDLKEMSDLHRLFYHVN